MKKLIIFGAASFAEMAHYFFSEDSDYDVKAFCVNKDYLDADTFKGLPLVAYEEIGQSFPADQYELFVAIGVEQVNRLRAGLAQSVLDKGYKLASFVSSRATVAKDVIIKPNTMIMDQVNIHPFVEIGWNTIVWSNSRIALKSRVGDHCWITSSIIGDGVTVGDYSFIGLNATITPAVTLGKHSVIGAGALITENSADGAVYKAAETKVSRVPSHRLRSINIIR